MSISISTFEKLPDLNQSVTLLAHLHVKEDILNLYGFESSSERALFLNLNTISGIGPRSAMNILSGTTPSEFKQKIINSDILEKTKDVTDVSTLKFLHKTGGADFLKVVDQDLKLLWKICKIPDFRKVSLQDPADIITKLFYFVKNSGTIPENWFAE